MEILTKKVTRFEEVTEDVVINLPDKNFTYQSFNYRQVTKVIPITLVYTGEGIAGYKFIKADGTGILHKQYWLSDLIPLMRKNVEHLTSLEALVVEIIRDVNEDINRGGDYLNAISEEDFTVYFNGILMSLLEGANIDQSELGFK